jgi:hypothetical protein
MNHRYTDLGIYLPVARPNPSTRPNEDNKRAAKTGKLPQCNIAKPLKH